MEQNSLQKIKFFDLIFTDVETSIYSIVHNLRTLTTQKNNCI